jgi:hypothetical protein
MPASRQQVRVAFGLAEAFDAGLVLLHVLDPLPLVADEALVRSTDVAS